MKKILTVSVAAYNIEKFIDQCVAGFITPQIIEDVEVIIVSDGSTDNTVELAKKYVNQYPEIFKLIEKENGGWGSTVNASLNIATGKYYKLLDGDDYFCNANLPAFIEVLRNSDADVVMSSYTTFEDVTENTIETFSMKGIEENKIYNIPEIHEKMLIAMHACTFKTKLLKEKGINITEKCFYTDAEYTLKALNECSNLEYYDPTVYMYRLGRDGQSVSFDSLVKHYKEHLKVLNVLLDYECTCVKECNKEFYRNRLQEMVSIQYAIFLGMQPNSEMIMLFKQFDRKIVNEYPWYDTIDGLKLKLIRKMGYRGLEFIYKVAKVKKVLGK